MSGRGNGLQNSEGAEWRSLTSPYHHLLSHPQSSYLVSSKRLERDSNALTYPHCYGRASDALSPVSEGSGQGVQALRSLFSVAPGRFNQIDCVGPSLDRPRGGRKVQAPKLRQVEGDSRAVSASRFERHRPVD